MLDYGLDLSEVAGEVALPDLLAEGDDLDAVVSAEPDWSRPTPAGDGRSAAALGEIPSDQALPWYGSEVTATLAVPLRLMEIWAHGQDVFDTVGVEHRPADRLKHVAALGVAGRELSFYAAQRIRGSARDFCLRITQRRTLDETSLAAIGDDAKAWLENARVFL